mgnify:CR=1 FL=1
MVELYEDHFWFRTGFRDGDNGCRMYCIGADSGHNHDLAVDHNTVIHLNGNVFNGD